jgi:hypothetical protein
LDKYEIRQQKKDVQACDDATTILGLETNMMQVQGQLHHFLYQDSKAPHARSQSPTISLSLAPEKYNE